jgi:hypothetical protein
MDGPDLTTGDDARCTVLRDNLARLAAGPEGLLREMAHAVLAGDIPLRDATASDTYGTELTKPFQQFWTTYQNMTPEERDQLIASGEEQLGNATD